MELLQKVSITPRKPKKRYPKEIKVKHFLLNVKRSFLSRTWAKVMECMAEPDNRTQKALQSFV